MSYENHLDDTRIQELLDRALPPEEERVVREHLDSCVRCREEVEAWRGLFLRLGEMPELDPSPALARKVMEEVRARGRVGLLERLRKLLPSGLLPGGHLEAGVLLEYLDRAVPAGKRARIGAHLDRCPGCREELVGWRGLVTRLEGLERLEPSEGFADAVMARVRIPEPAREAAPATVTDGLGRRAAAWVASWAGPLRPRSKKAWAMATVPLVAPVVVAAVGALALFSAHPLLTPGSLASFLFWQVTGAARMLAAEAVQGILAMPLVLEGWRIVREGLAEPVAVGAGALAFSAAMAAALWILYRNLAPAGVVKRGYANVSG